MKKLFSLFLLLLVMTSPSYALYDSSDDVVELTPNNFDSMVINSPNIWIVEFYAPWCGHCRSLVPEYKKLATALKGIVKVGAVDASEHQSLGGRYSVSGFPTVKIFGANKNSPVDYQGERKAESMAAQAMSVARETVMGRMGKKGSSGGGGGGRGNEGGSGSHDDKDVITLTDSNFEETVLKSDDIWLVEFFAPWCGHCKNLAPHWASAATQLKGKVKLGAIDATEHRVLASRFGIQGFPTIKFFGAGKKDWDSSEEYTGNVDCMEREIIERVNVNVVITQRYSQYIE
jgi:protein disulfide-isomerase A6